MNQTTTKGGVETVDRTDAMNQLESFSRSQAVIEFELDGTILTANDNFCAALGYCEKRAVLLMQQTGLMDSLNNIRAVACEYQQPVCMVVGLLGKEADRAPTESDSYGVRIIEPVLDAMEIDHILIEGPEDVAKLPPAIDFAYLRSRPMVALIGRRVVP